MDRARALDSEPDIAQVRRSAISWLAILEPPSIALIAISSVL
jgi:hypothetical protein